MQENAKRIRWKPYGPATIAQTTPFNFLPSHSFIVVYWSTLLVLPAGELCTGGRQRQLVLRCSGSQGGNVGVFELLTEMRYCLALSVVRWSWIMSMVVQSRGRVRQSDVKLHKLCSTRQLEFAGKSSRSQVAVKSHRSSLQCRALWDDYPSYHFATLHTISRTTNVVLLLIQVLNTTIAVVQLDTISKLCTTKLNHLLMVRYLFPTFTAFDSWHSTRGQANFG